MRSRTVCGGTLVLFSDSLGATSIPTAGDHPSAHYPIAGSVTAVGQLMYFLLLSLILRSLGSFLRYRRFIVDSFRIHRNLLPFLLARPHEHGNRRLPWRRS